MEFSRQESWSGRPFPSPGERPKPGIESSLLHCRQILYHLSHQGSPYILVQTSPPGKLIHTRYSTKCLIYESTFPVRYYRCIRIKILSVFLKYFLVFICSLWTICFNPIASFSGVAFFLIDL